jgi:two-component system cell cycle response regulator
MILMTGFADKEAPLAAIQLGVDDYIFKPFGLEEFFHSVNKIMEMDRLQKRLNYYKDLSNRDSLTNLYNHRYFFEVLDRELKRAHRYGHPVSLIFIDIDNFKHFNDCHGHLTGDLVLKHIGMLFLRNVRAHDLIFRYGGEEFAIVFPETEKEKTGFIAEKLQKALKEQPEVVHYGKMLRITISAGIATYPDDVEFNRDKLIECADQALYKAKLTGKNKVVLYGDSP